jgi:nicotinamide mononucleotide adenylyltransferase
MDKPTLTRNYTKKHSIILLAKSRISKCNIQGISIKTNPSEFNINCEKEARMLGFDRPQVLFDGSFSSRRAFQKGIIDKRLFSNNTLPDDYDDLDDDLKYLEIKQLFLDIESVYGGKTEGVVLRDRSGKNFYKFLQDDQHDQEVRRAKKQQSMMSPEEESEYWESIQQIANQYIQRYLNLNDPLRIKLRKASEFVNSYRNLPRHSQKTEQSIKDDLLLTLKFKINRKEPGNNNAVVLGKFRVFTKNGHQKMIDNALKEHDDVVITLVTSRDTRKTQNLRKRMIQAVFPSLEIIETTSGNLITIINKSSKNINTVYCGSDRIDAYKKQLKRSPDVSVKEIKRSDTDISASKVIQMIQEDDYAGFTRETPSEIHNFWEELRATYR